MKRALQRHDAGDARVIPVILRPRDREGAPFASLQALPKDGQPITNWGQQDEAFTDVARGIRKAVEDLRTAQSPRAPRGAAGEAEASACRRSGTCRFCATRTSPDGMRCSMSCTRSSRTAGSRLPPRGHRRRQDPARARIRLRSRQRLRSGLVAARRGAGDPLGGLRRARRAARPRGGGEGELAASRRRSARRSAPDRWLLVFDNATGAEDLLACCREPAAAGC